MAEKKEPKKEDTKAVASKKAETQKGAQALPQKQEKKKEVKQSKPQPKTDKKTYNPWTVLRFPHMAEKSANMIEMQNKLVFIVDEKATKKNITQAVERGFDVLVEGVNIERTPKGFKKAYIKLNKNNSALDIATRLGMI